MNKVVVFGKPGGGKSTLSRKLSAETGIKLQLKGSDPFNH